MPVAFSFLILLRVFNAIIPTTLNTDWVTKFGLGTRGTKRVISDEIEKEVTA